MVLLENHVDTAVRDAYFCPRIVGNMRCRKGNPCPHRIACAVMRLRRPKAPIRVTFDRGLHMARDRPCRYSLSLAFCAENAALALRAPSMSHCPALAPPAVKDSFNTILNSSILYRHCMSGTAASGRRAEQEIRTP